MQVIATCCAKNNIFFFKRFDQLEALGFLFASNAQQRKSYAEYVKMRPVWEEQW